VAGVIRFLSGFPGTVVAVDMPSGVSGDTGQIHGDAVKANHTVTFAFPKRGHFLYPGAEQVGELHVVDIGIPRRLAHERDIRAGLLTELDGPEMIPERALDSHKGVFGHLVVWAGSRETPGAGILALRGGLRAGAGLVSWAVDEATLDFAPEPPPEVMLKVSAFRESVRNWTERTLERATAVVAGPGLDGAGESYEHLYDLLELCEVPMCLDAEALNLMAERPELWKLIDAPVVITPHPKEMARLTASTVAAVQADRIGLASTFAMDRNCVVVLKGAHTVVSSPDGFSVVIGAGNPGMATGGSGDVLAGVIGAFLAAGLEPERAACGGALLHAVAGDAAAERLGETALIATDIIDALGPVLHSWGR
jgi:NAD(P)H-hydrate epimerase